MMFAKVVRGYTRIYAIDKDGNETELREWGSVQPKRKIDHIFEWFKGKFTKPRTIDVDFEGFKKRYNKENNNVRDVW